MKIGMLDYQLTNSHFKKFHTLLTGEIGGGDVTFVGAAEMEPTDVGRKWCADNNVPYSESAEELVAKSDAILGLAPNNPEKHLGLAGPVLTSGKPLFLDKLLAATPDHAEEIIRVAQKAKTPLFSASALRFAAEFEDLDKRLKDDREGVYARGYGKYPIYGVHTITLALRYFGNKVSRVIDTGKDGVRLITIEDGDRRGFVELRDSTNGKQANPWQVGVLTGGGYETVQIKDTEAFYANLMRNALQFFRTGESPVTVEEQLALVQVQHAAEKSFEQMGQWVDVKA